MLFFLYGEASEPQKKTVFATHFTYYSRISFALSCVQNSRQRGSSDLHGTMLKRQNNITWQCFRAALNGSTDRAENRGFCIANGQMAEAGVEHLLSYDKCWVLPDGIHTEPNKFDLSRWQLCIWGENQQLCVNKPHFGPSAGLNNNSSIWWPIWPVSLNS